MDIDVVANGYCIFELRTNRIRIAGPGYEFLTLIVYPPSTVMVVPVTYRESSDTK